MPTMPSHGRTKIVGFCFPSAVVAEGVDVVLEATFDEVPLGFGGALFDGTEPPEAGLTSTASSGSIFLMSKMVFSTLLPFSVTSSRMYDLSSFKIFPSATSSPLPLVAPDLFATT